MQKLKIKHLCRWGVLLVIGVLLIWWFLSSHILYTSDNLSLTYARNQSTFPSFADDFFYVHNNLLYFTEDSGDDTAVRVVKNNVIRTFAVIPGNNYQRFLILDEETLLVQIRDTIYSMNTEDEKLVELWSGTCVGCYENQVYFTDETTLYTAKITENEPQAVVSFLELLASYKDGIVYQSEEGIYQLFYEKPNDPQLLTSNEIPWPKEGSQLEVAYLYTTDFALRISGHSLDLYTYKTDEMQRIYATTADQNMVIMAISAGKDNLYISRQLVDLKFWPLENNEINGTCRYEIQTGSWARVSDETCSILVQFDEHSLYGYDSYNMFHSVKRFKVD